MKLAKETLSILMIDLLEDLVGKREPADLEPPLAWGVPIVKILIGRFQPTEIVAIHLLGHFVIRSEHYAILKFQKQVASAPRLASKLGFARPELHHHIRILLQHRLHPVEIFR